MNPLAAVILVVSALALLALPRRWAPVALLIGTCYVTRAQAVEIGPFNFTVVRMLLVVGALRVLMRAEFVEGGLRPLDWWMMLWGSVMVFTVAFHNDPGSQVIERLGLVFDAFGAYFLTRCFCRTWEEVTSLCRLTGIILAPIAVSMLVEKVTTHNFFAFLGGVPDISHIREGHVRAQGPFAHAILAGTIGAVCLPLALTAWRGHRLAALLGGTACFSMVVASGSSGPILSTAAAIGALMVWFYPRAVRWIRWGAVLGYVALDLVMKDPAYFILARIDLTGGSTGWHRARLIQSSLEHLSEWWLFGTDYTRHWMPSGVSWSPNHTDITNHYLYLGVLGGYPLMLVFLALMAEGFANVGRQVKHAPVDARFAIWTLGASLFAHAVTILSVSYFDSSILFFYLTLGVIGSAHRAAAPVPAVASQKAAPRRGVGVRVPGKLATRPVQVAERAPNVGPRHRDVMMPARRGRRR